MEPSRGSMALRMLTYKTRIWDRYRKAQPGEYLPLVVPALLAQVAGGWSSPTRFSDLFAPGVRELGGRDACAYFGTSPPFRTICIWTSFVTVLRDWPRPPRDSP
ncbi:MAG: Rpn family recombination-promoting nuclease/putative transposase [Nannocystaceae bacterium]|nr:Rpn family recombination-promoting nuclease/putative transposase [Nannocystaceae bacterium]